MKVHFQRHENGLLAILVKQADTCTISIRSLGLKQRARLMADAEGTRQSRALANDIEFGLAACYYSRDRSRGLNEIERRALQNDDGRSHFRCCLYKGAHFGVGRNDLNRDAGGLQARPSSRDRRTRGRVFAQGGVYIVLESEIAGDHHKMVEPD